MSDSISASTSTPKPALPTVPIFDRFGKRQKPIDPVKLRTARLRNAKRAAQIECELLAVEYSKTMLEKHIFAALELEKTDPALAAKLRMQIMERGIGRPPEADDEVAQRRRGGNVNDLTDFLHAISAASNAVAGITHKPATPVPGERDITPDVEHDHDAQWFEQYPTSTEDDTPQ
ncbi:hypothetical protein ACF8MH_03575 [Pseudomonas sp. YQ_13]|uniref:hypothetical protein n=1 Tax=Pseudomonas sp. YQ_13 TaxID=3367235 RepID=UPI00370B0763